MAVRAGDSHNFGRHVVVGERWVHKPRAILWEWLVLSAESPLRTLLAEAATRDGLGALFDFLPDLAFTTPEARDGGQVERVVLEPLRRPSPPTSAASSRASSAALSPCSGRAQHIQSALGEPRDRRRRARAGGVRAPRRRDDPRRLRPPDRDQAPARPRPRSTRRCASTRAACGACCPGSASPSTPATWSRWPPRTARCSPSSTATPPRSPPCSPRSPRSRPRRSVCACAAPRSTCARAEPLWPPLLAAESEQLARGDIPYFFRLHGARGIHWFADTSLTEVARLPLEGDVPQLDPILPLARALRGKHRKKLREGLFTRDGAFDHPEPEGLPRGGFRRRHVPGAHP